jgi:hypothetical protein
LVEYIYKIIDRFSGFLRGLGSLYNSLLFILILLYLPHLCFARSNKVSFRTSLLVLKVSELKSRVCDSSGGMSRVTLVVWAVWYWRFGLGGLVWRFGIGV